MEHFLPPRCPDCGSPMLFATTDMEDQGGPPENTWLCPGMGCGRALGSYTPGRGDHVCIPRPTWICKVGAFESPVVATTPEVAAEKYAMTLYQLGPLDPYGHHLDDPCWFIDVHVTNTAGVDETHRVYPTNVARGRR